MDIVENPAALFGDARRNIFHHHVAYGDDFEKQLVFAGKIYWRDFEATPTAEFPVDYRTKIEVFSRLFLQVVNQSVLICAAVRFIIK